MTGDVFFVWPNIAGYHRHDGCFFRIKWRPRKANNPENNSLEQEVQWVETAQGDIWVQQLHELITSLAVYLRSYLSTTSPHIQRAWYVINTPPVHVLSEVFISFKSFVRKKCKEPVLGLLPAWSNRSRFAKEITAIWRGANVLMFCLCAARKVQMTYPHSQISQTFPKTKDRDHHLTPLQFHRTHVASDSIQLCCFPDHSISQNWHRFREKILVSCETSCFAVLWHSFLP